MRRFRGEEDLADRGDVQRGVRADDLYHAHHAAVFCGAFDVDHFVDAAHRQVDGFAERAMQFMHMRQCFLAHADTRFHQAAQFNQADTQLVSARLDAVDQPAVDHHAENAVRGRRMQLGRGGELLQRRRRGMLGQHIEQMHHALDDLDRRFCRFFGHGMGYQVDVLD